MHWEFLTSEGAEVDLNTAVQWYQRAADQGHPDGQFNLGAMFYDGQGVAQSYDEAEKWFRLAAAQGDANALFNLGECYENGDGVPQDLDEALLERATALGCAEAAAKTADLEALRK
mmetsp:Transcript_28828/g.102030  ORF Transcript_28828/g.102030 Transcript_28828/m.102030 type:complete len:116 (+) Transcript_28828:437-784(+)